MNEIISSRKVSSVLNKAMKPVLINDGFTHFKGRSAYKFHDRYTLGFTTRAVGSYFSDITGFSPSSFCADLWINYKRIPSEPVKPEKNGVLLPKAMHEDLELNVVNNHHQTRTGISQEAELNRRDVWWIAPDGTNLEDVKDDLLEAYSLQKQDWLEIYTNPLLLIKQVKNNHDCFDKYETLFAMALDSGRKDLVAKYKEKYYEYIPKWISDDPSLIIK